MSANVTLLDTYGACHCGCGAPLMARDYVYKGKRRGVRRTAQFAPGHYAKLHATRMRERFWQRLIHTDAGCWEWPLKKDRQGYGMARIDKQTWRAHRYAYTQARGPIPDGLELDHLCRNPSCCNPDHLEPVTTRENLMRGRTLAAANAAKTHCLRGHPFSKENTYVAKGGGRHCRACQRYRSKVARAARKGREAEVRVLPDRG